MTRLLLACGVIAGPLYVIVGAIEAFAPTRHDLSLLSNGNMGWVHIALFVLTGLLTVACAVGMRRALRGGVAGPGGLCWLASTGLA